MKSVVVTGSTRGIGRGLAENFLKRGCRVVIHGRQQAQVQEVVETLAAEYGADRVAGQAADISDYHSLQSLWQYALSEFSVVDLWVNNAGMSLERMPFWEIAPERMDQIVGTNLLGMMYANRICIEGMRQQGHGQIWNMEGFGSDGMTQAGLTCYGSTKRAVTYLTKSLAKEVAETPVQVCYLSPGIVVTELLTGDYDLSSEQWRKTKKTLNILGDTVETVTPYLVDGMLANTKNGAKVAWLTPGKAFRRFMLAGFNKRDLFVDAEIKAGVRQS